MGERSLTTAIRAEVAKGNIQFALFVEMIFDGGTVRLWTGYGNFTLNSHVFTGAGHLGKISAVEETVGDVRANGVAFTLSGIDVPTIALCLTEHFQGRPATVWLAFFNSDWVIIPDAVQIFKGRMDYPIIEKGGETASITVYVESRLIDLERPRVRRYTAEDQQQLHPGDTGLRFIAGLQEKTVRWVSGKLPTD
jgi:hypothetical protein